jgi:dTDP-4-dehydrorhamnose 3,5-epimerase
LQFEHTDLPGVIVVAPDVHRDGRGFFLESYHAEKYLAGGIAGPFVQDNHSQSVAGTLRGLHLQLGRPQGKLVRAVEVIFDVAVDVRVGSRHSAAGSASSSPPTTSGSVMSRLALRTAFASSVRRPRSIQCTDFYDPETEIGLAWNDPALAIAWPVREPILSKRDQQHRRLDELLDVLPRWSG